MYVQYVQFFHSFLFVYLEQRLEEEGCLVYDPDSLDGLLNGESYDGDHCEPPVLDLLELHLLPLHRGLGVEAEGVEAEVPWDVPGVPLAGDTVKVDGGGKADDDSPVERADLAQAPVEEGRDAVGGVNEGRGVEDLGEPTVEELRDGPAGGGEHGKAGVLDLDTRGSCEGGVLVIYNSRHTHTQTHYLSIFSLLPSHLSLAHLEESLLVLGEPKRVKPNISSELPSKGHRTIHERESGGGRGEDGGGGGDGLGVRGGRLRGLNLTHEGPAGRANSHGRHEGVGGSYDGKEGNKLHNLVRLDGVEGVRRGFLG